MTQPARTSTGTPVLSLLVWVCRGLLGLVRWSVRWLLRHPAVALILIVALVVPWRDPVGTAVIGAWLLLLAVVWRLVTTRSLRRRARFWLRARRRSLVIYRPAWRAAVVSVGLTITDRGREYRPAIKKITSNCAVDEITAVMLPGQTVEDWSKNAPRLAQTFGVLEARVRSVPGRPRLVRLWFLINDPLCRPIQMITTVDRGVDLQALPVGVCEDGELYRLRLLDSHVLVAGATGSGKGSVLWSTIAALAPDIDTGRVALWVVDPKGGMELAPGAGLFARFVYGDPEDGEAEREFADLLEDAVAVMRRRQNDLRGVTRLHRPTANEPLIVLVIDELASLTAYATDRDAKKRIATALSLLLSQGRAVGVSVIGALQDPRKEVLPFRDLFPTRIALRLAEAEQVAFVLGNGARDRGARCDQIPETLPGVGYVALDGVAEPVRVRFAHITDHDIAGLAGRYAHRDLVDTLGRAREVT